MQLMRYANRAMIYCAGRIYMSNANWWQCSYEFVTNKLFYVYSDTALCVSRHVVLDCTCLCVNHLYYEYGYYNTYITVISVNSWRIVCTLSNFLPYTSTPPECGVYYTQTRSDIPHFRKHVRHTHARTRTHTHIHDYTRASWTG